MQVSPKAGTVVFILITN